MKRLKAMGFLKRQFNFNKNKEMTGRWFESKSFTKVKNCSENRASQNLEKKMERQVKVTEVRRWLCAYT